MTPVLGEIVGWELLLVLLLIALLFGSSKLPGLARSMGQATKEFRKGIEDGADDDDAKARRPKRTTTPPPRRPETPLANKARRVGLARGERPRRTRVTARNRPVVRDRSHAPSVRRSEPWPERPGAEGTESGWSR